MIHDSTVERWLREDVGHHDVTNDVPGETTGRLVAKESGVAAGLDPAAAVFDYLDVAVTDRVEDGVRVDAGDAVLSVEGPARDVLRGERVAVNVAGHASGIATKTREAVDRAREVSDDVRVACTRKTTPGLRGIEKRAVVAGGGDTHRLDLSHMVMVKDNHVAEMGLEAAVEHFRDRVSFATKIEVEVETPEDAPRAARAGADVVLLDNMTPAETARAVDLLRETAADGVGGEPANREAERGEASNGVSGETANREPSNRAVLAEASGGITVETVPEYAATGVDVVSMGSLTHSAPTLDYSFRTG